VSERRVWICQCLCPSRHCIVASTDEAESEAEAKKTVRAPLRRQVAEMLSSGAINPWCAMCGAKRSTWRYELGRTVFGSMEEALPAMQEMQARNMVANRIFGDLHRTTKPN